MTFNLSKMMGKTYTTYAKMNESDEVFIEAIRVWIDNMHTRMDKNEINLLANHLFNLTIKRMMELYQ